MKMDSIPEIKQMCDILIKNPTVKTATNISEILTKIDGRTLQILQETVLYSILSQIDKVDTLDKNEIKVILINCITNLLTSTTLFKIVPVKTTLMILIHQIYDPINSTIYSEKSDEFKLSIIECLDIIYRKMSTDVTCELYTKENQNFIAKTLMICVYLIEKETYRKLRIASIKCLISAFHVHDQADLSDTVLRDQISSEVFCMLPKVVYTLRDVINGDEKQGQLLFTLSIKALGRILCLIMEDYNKDDIIEDIKIEDFKQLIDKSTKKQSGKTDATILGMLAKNDEAKKLHFETVKKTSEWLEAAARKLQSPIQSLNKFVGNKNMKVRFELAILSCNLIERCSRFMASCLPQLLQITISLSQDENTEISQKCSSTLVNIIKIKISSNLDIMENIFHSQLVTLPRTICTGDEEEQIAAFLLIKGLLRFMSDSRLKIVLSNEETLNKFTLILLSSVELIRSIDLLQDEYSIRTIDDVDLNKYPWKQFQNLRNSNLIQEISEICKILGNSRASNIVTNHLLDLFAENNMNCNEIIILLQLLLNGVKDTTVIAACLNEFLIDIHWNLAIQANKSTHVEMEEFGESYWHEDKTEGIYESAVSIRFTDICWKNPEEKNSEDNNAITINDAKFNVLHICLIVESVGLFALALKQDFQPYLLKSFHRILEETGSSNYMIHTAGVQALNKIKIALNFGSLAELIHNNADYVAYFVNIALKKEEQIKSALDVLSVVLKYSSLESIPHLENIILTVLNESSKNYQFKNIVSFLKVFEMILTGIHTWVVCKIAVSEMQQTNDINIENEQILCQQWLDIIQKEDNFENDSNELLTDESSNNIEEEIKDDQETKQEIPKHIELTINILKRFLKYISSKNRVEKIIALEAMSIGLEIIKEFENELLPLVHLVWYPFSERLKDKDPVVLRRCFKLLIILGKLAKDFIYRRTSTDVMPHIVNFLKTSSIDSLKKNKDFSYVHTQQFKFQEEILKDLPSLLIDLEIPEQDLSQIVDAIIPFIRRDQHQALQQSGITCLINFSVYDPAAVYVKLLKYIDYDLYKVNVLQLFSKI